MTDRDTETLAEVLAAHVQSGMTAACSCGEDFDRYGWRDLHAAHVAAVLEPIIAARIEQARAGEGALRERIEAAVREAFSGDEFEENAAAAAGEGEWSWFRWLAEQAVRAALAAAPGDPS